MTTIAANLSQHRILVVDDEAEHLQLLQEALEILHNAVVFTARNSREAAVHLADFQPTLIVIDISIPDDDDFKLIESLRQKPETRDLPIFALAPYATRDEGQRMLTAGFDAYMNNPFDVPTLGSQLLALLDTFVATHRTYASIEA